MTPSTLSHGWTFATLLLVFCLGVSFGGNRASAQIPEFKLSASDAAEADS